MLVLVDKDIKKLLSQKALRSLSRSSLDAFVQPASLDLPVGKEIFLVDQKFLPLWWSVEEHLLRHQVKKVRLRRWEKYTLFKGQTYLIPVLDISLPEGIEWRLSPKSSIGRIDLLVRGVFDNVAMYDIIPTWSKWRLRLEVTPQSFNVDISPGVSLSQLMFLAGQKRGEIKVEELKEQILLSSNHSMMVDGKLVFTIDLEWEVVWYKAISTSKVIDLTKTSFYNPEDFFKPVKLDPCKAFKRLTLRAGDFYIFATKEIINVPLNIALEWHPFSHLLGELRVHYAWFFDPGFRAKGVMEVRARENIKLYDGQPIGMFEIYFTKWAPATPYWSAGNNYQGQKWPRLAKFFKEN